jgi:predicted nucleic acid-binding protein
MVLDTNILVSALRSRLGASHRLLLAVGDNRFQIQLSVSLLLEYEAAIKNPNAASNFHQRKKTIFWIISAP